MENIKLAAKDDVGIITYEINSEKFTVTISDPNVWKHAFLMWTTDPSFVLNLITNN